MLVEFLVSVVAAVGHKREYCRDLEPHLPRPRRLIVTTSESGLNVDDVDLCHNVTMSQGVAGGADPSVPDDVHYPGLDLDL